MVELLWDLVHFYSSLGASCTAAFKSVPFNVIQLSWQWTGPLCMVLLI